MRDKERDIPYCNVDKNKIMGANPVLYEENLQFLYNWITIRYKIHINKDVLKLPPPWTTDAILTKYRFTNVRREQDKETKWLIENVSNNKKISYENKILNSILFRLFNKSQTLEIFGNIDFDNLNIETIKNKYTQFKQKNSKYIYFSNAFYTSGPKAVANKLYKEFDLPLKMILLVQKYKQQGIIDKIKKAKSQLHVYELLKECLGIGQFLAYQIFVDLTYIKDFPFSENEFVAAGPGCKKGLDMLFKEYSGLSYEEAIFWIRDNQNKIFSKFGFNTDRIFFDIPKEERPLNIMSIQNCFCELSKYIRAIKKEGRPRILYKQLCS